MGVGIFLTRHSHWEAVQRKYRLALFAVASQWCDSGSDSVRRWHTLSAR